MISSIAAQIRGYVVESFLFGQDDESLGSEDSLLGRGVVDSTGVLELVGFLEESFGIEVEDAEVVPEHFDSIARLAQFVAQKRGLALEAAG